MTDEHAARSTASLLRLCKLLYFLGGFSGATFGRFSTIFYLTVAKLSPHQIGIVEASQPISGALGNQIWGYVSDRLQRKKVVALAGRIVSTVLLMMLMLPAVAHSFTHIVVVMVTMAFFSVGDGVLNAYTLDLLGDARRGEYGRYRLWLAVSWGVGNAIMGIVAQINFNINFILFASLSALSVVIMGVALPARTQGEKRIVAERKLIRHTFGNGALLLPGEDADLRGGAASAPDAARSGGDGELSSRSDRMEGRSSLRASLCRARMVAFLVELGLLGVGFTLVEKFIFVYAIDELGASPSLCGYSVAITVLFEIPIFHFGEWLLRWLGHDAMLWLSVLSYALRVFGYTRLRASTVWYLLALEPFHGITYGLAWTAAVDKMKCEVPPEWQTTSQLLLSTCMWSFGRTAGSLFGGFFYASGSFLGLRRGQALYMLAGCGATAVLTLHAATTLLLRACGQRGLHTPLQSKQQQQQQQQPALLRPHEPPLVEESVSVSSQQVSTPTRGGVN